MNLSVLFMWYIIIMHFSIKCGNDSTLTNKMLRQIKRCFEMQKYLESAEGE